MNLIPNNSAIKCRLPMHHVSSQTPAGNTHYTLQEKAFGHLIIRASFDDKKTRKLIESIIGLKLPSEALSSNEEADVDIDKETESHKTIINWLSPDEVLLLVPENTEFKVEKKLREAMTGHYAIINITGGQTVLELAGERAESIIKKSSSYDIHPNNFPIGKVVTTIFAKSQVVLRRTGDDSFELVVRRSFSDYLWKWIVDAGSRE